MPDNTGSPYTADDYPLYDKKAYQKPTLTPAIDAGTALDAPVQEPTSIASVSSPSLSSEQRSVTNGVGAGLGVEVGVEVGDGRSPTELLSPSIQSTSISSIQEEKIPHSPLDQPKVETESLEPSSPILIRIISNTKEKEDEEKKIRKFNAGFTHSEYITSYTCGE